MLKDRLVGKRDGIVRKWLELIAQTHPAGMNLLNNMDRFTNPVRYAFASGTEVLYDELLEDRIGSDEVLKSLDDILKVRALQDFSPGQAVGFMFLLKRAIRESIGSEIRDQRTQEELAKFESRIDDLALLAFDVYMSCREKIFEVRVGEIKTARDDAFRLLDRMSRRPKQLEEGEGGVG